MVWQTGSRFNDQTVMQAGLIGQSGSSLSRSGANQTLWVGKPVYDRCESNRALLLTEFNIA